MCYDVSYLTKKLDKYAKHYGKKQDWEDISKKLPPTFHTSAFNHPDVPVITGENPDKVQAFEWGLIPPWVADAANATKLASKTINARSEEMFEKPSFRHAAKTNHCLIIVDGFFEHHWKNGKSYPYFIKMTNDEPFALAGIWEDWHGKKTVSVLTTAANGLISKIHNNPKAKSGPRMPVIIKKGDEQNWLKPIHNNDDKKAASQLLLPYSEKEMEAYTVPKLRGKNYMGNIREIQKKVLYPELENGQSSLFLTFFIFCLPACFIFKKHLILHYYISG